MGYQLWTSPQTGYRRRGTRLPDLSGPLTEHAQISPLVEPLRAAPAGAPSTEIFGLLRDLDFDIAGVREEQGGPIIGYVRREELSHGLVKDHLRQCSADLLIDEEASVRSLLRKLRDTEFVLVKRDGRIEGIATRADLNKPLVRTYFFGLISLFEIHLSYWISRYYPNRSWEGSITVERLEKARVLQAERREQGQVMELQDCLYFTDKRNLVSRSEDLRVSLNLGSRKQCNSLLIKVEQLRNTLAHSHYDITSGSSWTDLLTLVSRVETAVELSDELVEQYARTVDGEVLGRLY